MSNLFSQFKITIAVTKTETAIINFYNSVDNPENIKTSNSSSPGSQNPDRRKKQWHNQFSDCIYPG